MTTQTEAGASPKDAALKLALEALKSITWVNSFNEGDYLTCNFKNVEASITAIKEALAGAECDRQPEQEPAAWQRDVGTGRRFMPHGILPSVGKETGWTPLYTTPPQPEQEPVAIRQSNGETYILDGALVPIGTLLYTTPPQRTTEQPRQWVGLDNDDLVWIYSNSDTMGQAIENTEAKLKEKNT